MKKLLQIILPLLGIGILAYVWSVSIGDNGGIAGTFNLPKEQLTYNLVRLAGLTAFTLVSFQVITGPFMHLFKKIYGDNFYLFHAYSGLTVLLFALTHFTLIHLYMHYFGYTISSFSALYPRPYIDLGPIALVLLGMTVPTAALAVLILGQKPRHWWRYIHYANYAVFLLVFMHSTHIGTDVAGPDSKLKPLWYVFLVLFILGFIYKRFFRVWQKAQASQQPIA
jgi:predicted ferric reductase